MANKKKTKGKGVKAEGACDPLGGPECVAPTVCTTVGECVKAEMDKYMPDAKPGTAPVPGGKQGKY